MIKREPRVDALSACGRRSHDDPKRRERLLPAASLVLAAPPAPAGSAAAQPRRRVGGGRPERHAGEDQGRRNDRSRPIPTYPPQSELKPDGTFEGFDIDVANEIGKRLGVKVQFETPRLRPRRRRWLGWPLGHLASGRSPSRSHDSTSSISPSRTTSRRPRWRPAPSPASRRSTAWPARRSASESTTYQLWLEGKLQLGDGSALAAVPAGAVAAPLDTDQLCAQAIQSRGEYPGWLSSSTTVASAIKGGTPVVAVGDPVFFEPLAVATDKKGKDPHAALDAAAGQDHQGHARRRDADRREQEVVRRAGPDHQEMTAGHEPVADGSLDGARATRTH